MKCRKSVEGASLELSPAFLRQRDSCAPERDADQREFFCDKLDFVGAESAIRAKLVRST